MKKLLIYLCLFSIFYWNHALAQLKYPHARKVPFDTIIHDIKISDDYFWMSRRENKSEMLDFCKQQSNLAHGVLDSVPGLSILQKEIDESYLSIQDEIWNMSIANNTIYYYRDIPNEGSWLCRRKTIDSPEEKILSSVKINGQKYSIRKRVYAHNKPLLALMLTQKGETNPQIRIYDLDTKQFLKDSIAPVMFNDSRGVSMSWTPDDKGLFYTQSPPTSKHKEIYYNGKIKLHFLGTASETDEPVFGIALNKKVALKPTETPYIYSFKNSPYLIARIRAGDGDNYAFAVHYSKLNGSKTPWKKLSNYVNLGDGFDANGKWLYAATTGVPRYRIVKIDLESGAAPKEFVPQQENVIAGTDYKHNKAIIAGKNVLYALIRKIGEMQIMKVEYATKKITYLPIHEKASISQLMLMGDDDLVFRQFSPIKCSLFKLYKHDKGTINSLPFADKALDLNNDYTTQVMLIPSRDGKMIPLSIVYLKTINLKNNNPILIDSYGNSGASTDLEFDPSFMPWLKRGGIYAFAHVRGGGELGEEWYKDGQYPNKMNSVNDIVDIADWLVKNNYSSPSKILVMGASAGTFLVGNAINQRPDLFAGGIYIVGLPDIATHTDAAGAREEKSIGTKNTKDGFLSNYNLSAYYHIPKNKNLPSMLLMHGATDYILAMHPIARYAARLQEEQKGNNHILFQVDWEGGHAGSSNDIFQILKFSLWKTGHPEFQLKKNNTN